jgi:hypothetical protein
MVSRVYRLLAGTVAVAGLSLQFWLMTKYPDAQSISQTTTRFLSFFTIQTNILIALCMLLPALIPSFRMSQPLSNPSLRTAVMSYSALVAIVYFALLRNIGNDDGLERRADQILHYVTPTLFLIDWVVWVPRARVSFTAAPAYLIYPGLYCASVFLYGALTGWHPYPFVDAVKLGTGQLATNIVGVTIVALAIPYTLLVLDRLLASLQKTTQRSELKN